MTMILLFFFPSESRSYWFISMAKMLWNEQHWCSQSSETLHRLPELLRSSERGRVSRLYALDHYIWLHIQWNLDVLRVCIYRCLKCLQQVKHEYGIIKTKLESLFQVKSRPMFYQCSKLVLRFDSPFLFFFWMPAWTTNLECWWLNPCVILKGPVCGEWCWSVSMVSSFELKSLYHNEWCEIQ